MRGTGGSGERGSGGIEYLSMLLIVALSMTFGIRYGSGIEFEETRVNLCEPLQLRCILVIPGSEGKSDDEGPDDDSSDDDGDPSDDDGEDDDAGDSWEVNVEHETKTPDGRVITTTVAVDVGDVELAADCSKTQSATLRTTTDLSREFEAKLKALDIKGKFSVGSEVSYQISGPPGTVSDPGNWYRTTILDPSSIPPGGSVELTELSYAQMELSASYRDLVHLSSTEKVAGGVVVGVQRLDNGKVRVHVGPKTVVEHALRLGVGGDDYQVAVGASESHSSSKLVSVDIDPTTSAGRDAYLQMVLGGRKPAPGSSVSSATESEVYDWSKTRELTAKIKALGFSVKDGERGSFVITTTPDGRKQYSYSTHSNGLDATQVTTVGEGGERDHTVSIRFQDVEGIAAEHMRNVTGASDDTDDFTVQFDEAQLKQYQLAIGKRLADFWHNTPNVAPDGLENATSQEVLDHIQRNPDQARLDVGPLLDAPSFDLAAAKDPSTQLYPWLMALTTGRTSSDALNMLLNAIYPTRGVGEPGDLPGKLLTCGA